MGESGQQRRRHYRRYERLIVEAKRGEVIGEMRRACAMYEVGHRSGRWHDLRTRVDIGATAMREAVAQLRGYHAHASNFDRDGFLALSEFRQESIEFIERDHDAV